jgi:galactokinase/mevalonate kinase-like predicted kinase
MNNGNLGVSVFGAGSGGPQFFYSRFVKQEKLTRGFY